MQQTIQQVPKQVQLEFYNLNKLQLQYIYDALNCDLDSLYRVLNGIKNPEQIDKLIEQLDNYTQRNDILEIMMYGNIKQLKNFLKNRMQFEELIQKFKLINIQEVQQELKQEEIKQRPLIIQNSTLLNFPKITLFQIMNFLDPISLHQIRLVCLYFNELFNTPVISDKFYEKFCRALFDQQIQYPLISPFECIKEYVNNNLHLYDGLNHNELINKLNADPSLCIWENWGNVQQQEVSFNQLQKLYKSNKDMYDQQLRINYCGVYAIKESYIKYGEANFNQTSAPCIKVDYFRYLRFWRDGTFTMYISCKKLNKATIIEYFSTQEYIHPNTQKLQSHQQKSDIESFLRGEYRIFNDEVHAISCRHSSTFYYIYKIKNYKNQYPGNILLVTGGQLHILGDEYRQDIIDTYKKNYFVYKHLESLRNTLQEGSHGWKSVVF